MTVSARPVGAPRYEPPTPEQFRQVEVQAQLIPPEPTAPGTVRSPRFGLVLRTYRCQAAGCGAEIPYKGGRPPKWCPPCKAERNAKMMEDSIAEAKRKRREAREARQLRHPDTVTVEFLRRPGVASLAVQFGFHKVFVHDVLFEGETLEEAVAKAQAATDATADPDPTASTDSETP